MARQPLANDQAAGARQLPPGPTALDFFLTLAGCSASLFLADLSGFQANVTEQTPAAVGPLWLKFLPTLLFLPLGVLLLWPLFYATQRLRGRPQTLTAGEWLWGVAWLGALVLTAWIAWCSWGTPPELLQSAAFKGHVFTGYAVGVLALAAVALLVGLIDLIGRWPQPWTHRFALALLTWPVLPLAALLVWKIELK